MMNKSISIPFLTLILSVQVTACKNEQKKENNQDTSSIESVSDNTSPVPQQPKQVQDTIPISTTELGDFPFFSFPDGLISMNRPIQRNFDMLYFPINGIMIPIEGKVWKTNVSAIDGYDARSLT